MKRIPSLILLVAFISALLPLEANAEYGWIPRQYRRKLPSVDKVELQKLIPAEHGFSGVEKTKTFEGAEARRLASLWRSQNFHSMAAFCHNPAYGIKFFSRGRMILYASVCWECNNIEVVEPTLKSNSVQGFAGESKIGRRLLEEFKRTFP